LGCAAAVKRGIFERLHVGLECVEQSFDLAEGGVLLVDRGLPVPPLGLGRPFSIGQLLDDSFPIQAVCQACQGQIYTAG
jgi:hypothetical protein